MIYTAESYSSCTELLITLQKSARLEVEGLKKKPVLLLQQADK